MALHGLKVGQNIHEKSRDAAPDFRDLTPEEQAVQQTPVADLNLSVRSRKCMTGSTSQPWASCASGLRTS